MTWVAATGFARRPLVVVEDHLHHVSELLEALAAADASLLALTTVVCLDRSGPDTTRLAAGWLEAYPALQVAARLDGDGDVPAPLRPRRRPLAQSQPGREALLPPPTARRTSAHSHVAPSWKVGHA